MKADPANERCFTEQGSSVVPKAWKAGKERRERKRGRGLRVDAKGGGTSSG